MSLRYKKFIFLFFFCSCFFGGYANKNLIQMGCQGLLNSSVESNTVSFYPQLNISYERIIWQETYDNHASLTCGIRTIVNPFIDVYAFSPFFKFYFGNELLNTMEGFYFFLSPFSTINVGAIFLSNNDFNYLLEFGLGVLLPLTRTIGLSFEITCLGDVLPKLYRKILSAGVFVSYKF